MSDNEKKDCCENESEYYQLDQDQQVQTFDFELINPIFLTAVIAVFLNHEGPSAQKDSPQFLTYRPPIVSEDIVVSLQRYLC